MVDHAPMLIVLIASISFFSVLGFVTFVGSVYAVMTVRAFVLQHTNASSYSQVQGSLLNFDFVEKSFLRTTSLAKAGTLPSGGDAGQTKYFTSCPKFETRNPTPYT